MQGLEGKCLNIPISEKYRGGDQRHDPTALSNLRFPHYQFERTVGSTTLPVTELLLSNS
jgi:hypothetical protein